MEPDPDCIFCKIVAGELPCFKLHEDEDTLAFMDINPLNDGHALVIAKGHHVNLFETPDEALAAVASVVKRVAQAVQEVLAPDGLNVLQANGPAAGQSVYHYHVHVLPRRSDDDAKINWGLRPGDMARIEELAGRVRARLSG
jgi:histidine triad (HIT) family protein